ncbi:MAG TPA: hypothetical protein VFH40_03740 [Gemmatimonadales bacterium]|jgi:hypothetical protein|nr:hypothetical protein [Gemmatimonadales bacterium]
MAQPFDLVSWTGRLRAALLTGAFLVGACNATDSFVPDNSSTPPATTDVPSVDEPSFSTSYAGGMPIGHFHQPLSLYGTTYNGAMLNISASELRNELSSIRNRGGKVMVTFVGAERYYKDSGGHFSLTKWKARLDRYKNVDISSFIRDGTLIGTFLIDEPNDPRNWGGRAISYSTLEEMARYSKMRFPGLATVVRAEASWMAKYSGTYHYVDAAWAQYLSRRGNVNDYIRNAVASAQKKGLALVVGLNVLKGGNPNQTPMNASELKAYGSALLSSSYPCAFLSWRYDSNYLSSSSIRDAMKYLRNKAQARGYKSCRS